MIRLWLVALLFALPATAQAQRMPVPDLLRRALAQPASNEAFAYEFEDVAETGNGEREVTSITRGQVDPSRKRGDRVTITFAERKGGDDKVDLKKIDERYERNGGGGIFCDTFSREDVANAVDRGATPDGVHLFSFTPKAEDDADGEIKNLMKKMTVEAAVDEATATLRLLTGSLTRSHSVMLIAEVKAVRMKSDCEPAPNGRAYAARREFQISGSALGQAFATSTVQTISNVRRVALATR
jgi:hypothetical protein